MHPTLISGRPTHRRQAPTPQELSKAAIEAIFRRYFRDWTNLSEAYFRDALPNPLVLREGIIIEHSPKDRIANLFYDIFVQDCYTPPNFYSPRPKDTVLDVGANIGVFAIYLAWRALGIQVHCFEPSTDTRTRLLKNVRHNRLGKMVHVHGCAIFSTACRRRLWDGPSTSLNSFFGPSSRFSGGNCEEVECVPLATALEYAGTDLINLVKIDVEGAELDILQGMTETAWKRVRRFAIEFHEDLRPGVLAKLMNILTANHFELEVDTAPPFSWTAGIIRATRKQRP